MTCESNKDILSLLREILTTLKEIKSAMNPDQTAETLEQQLREAADWWHDAVNLSNTRGIQDLIRDGYDLHEDILPAVRASAKFAVDRNSWRFFDVVVRNNEAERLECKTTLSDQRRNELASYVYAEAGSRQLAAWDAYLRDIKGVGSPVDMKGGWWFPSEFPPSKE